MSCENQAVTMMPKYCILYPCCKTPKKAKLKKDKNGFMVCQNCKKSYGAL